MARTAASPVSVKLPKDLPEGIEVLQAERRLTGAPESEQIEVDGKKQAPKAVVSVLAPAVGNAEGVRNYIALRSELLAGENQGVIDASNALRSEAFNVVPHLTMATVENSRSLWLPFTGPRVIDPYEATTARITQFMRDNGRMPNQKELEEIYAGLVG